MDAPQRERRGATLTIPHEVLEHRADAKKLTLLVRRRLGGAVDALGDDVRRSAGWRSAAFWLVGNASPKPSQRGTPPRAGFLDRPNAVSPGVMVPGRR